MRSRTVVTLSAVAVVVLAGAALAGWWMLRPPSIRDAAEDYLRALQAGDLPAIQQMAPEPLPETTRDAFTGAEAHITSAHVDGIGSDGSVRATARLAGAPVHVFFTLIRDGHRYRLQGDFLGSAQVHPTLGDVVRLGEARVLAGATVHLLPAVYPISAVPADILRGTSTMVVSNEKPVSADLDVSYADTAASVAERRLAAYEDRCAASADAVPAHCGLRVPWAADLRTLEKITFRIDERPSLILDGTTFAATGGAVTATAHGEGWDGASRTFSYQTSDWALRGRVVFDGAQMQLRVD